MLDHYDTLKIARDAPPEVIKAAYRALQRKYHPDVSDVRNEAAAHEHSALINLAYQELIEPAKRANYDRAWLAINKGIGGMWLAPDGPRRRRRHSWIRGMDGGAAANYLMAGAGALALAAATALGHCIGAGHTPSSALPAPPVSSLLQQPPTTRNSEKAVPAHGISVDALTGRLTYRLGSSEFGGRPIRAALQK